MSLVFCTLDPSGFGMFSKTGRHCMKKHMIFSKKDEIMSGKKKVKRISAYGNIDEVTSLCVFITPIKEIQKLNQEETKNAESIDLPAKKAIKVVVEKKEIKE